MPEFSLLRARDTRCPLGCDTQSVWCDGQLSVDTGDLITKRGGRMITRRQFLDGLAVGAADMAIASTAKSYAQIMGANERVNFAVIGTNSRGYAHLAGLKANA